MKKINVKLLVENIYKIAKERNIRLGDLEAAADVSQGYFSRLRGKKEAAVPSIEVVAAVAETLKVSIDALVYESTEQLTPNEKRIMAFIDKLILDTRTHTIDWTREKREKLINQYIDPVSRTANHPLFYVRSLETPDSTPEQPDIVYLAEYGSCFTRPHGEVTDICGDSFMCSISLDHTIYLEKVQVLFSGNDGISDDKIEYELYLYTNGNVVPICRSNNDDSFIDSKLEILYSAAAEVTSHIQMDTRVKIAIDEYLSGSHNNADILL